MKRALLCHLARQRFGKACADQPAYLLALVDDIDRLADAGEWIIDCEKGDGFLARVRQWAGAGER